MQGLAAPRPLPNDALRFRAVNDFPRFADRFSRRKLLAEKTLQPPSTPVRSMKSGSKTSGEVGGSFISAARLALDGEFVRQPLPTKLRT